MSKNNRVALVTGAGMGIGKSHRRAASPRWSTYDAKALGMAPRDDLPVSIQERAWTSPIWYTP